ncbi:hypothetical protein CWS02_00990 [Enterobacter sp. EA-1]|nr:hypothetical protein CWS02_00990 [Enterobacter sp. EA-1]
MPAWRVNLSPKSENVIATVLPGCCSKWLTIALCKAGCKSHPDALFHTLFLLSSVMWNYMLIFAL